MKSLTLTGHAAMRMAQRSIKFKDAELIALIGTEVEDGYLVRVKDYQEVETQLKRLLNRLRRIVGKRLVVADGTIVTAYHASRTYQRQLLRNAYESDLCE
jgi:RNA-binding protein YhbY